LNDSEKSKTNFDKFIYSIHNEDIEILMMDKEHYNTLSLLKNNEKEFYFHAHNRIYQYILTFFILLLTSKLFFFYKSKKNVLKYYAIIFLVLLGIQVINSYLIYLLNYNEIFNLYFYYIINLLILSIFNYLIIRLNENN
jgi:lipopolysaccharide export LptBFGC system permease protein LptF